MINVQSLSVFIYCSCRDLYLALVVFKMMTTHTFDQYLTHSTLVVFQIITTRILDRYLTRSWSQTPKNCYIWIYYPPMVTSNLPISLSHYIHQCIYMMQRPCESLVVFQTMTMRTLDRYLAHRSSQRPPKSVYLDLLPAHGDLYTTQSMIPLHSFMYIYMFQRLCESLVVFLTMKTRTLN